MQCLTHFYFHDNITLHYNTLHYITLHFITLHYITLHYIALHHTTSHYITLHYIILLYITLHLVPQGDGWISREAAGLAFDFVPSDPCTYVTGTYTTVLASNIFLVTLLDLLIPFKLIFWPLLFILGIYIYLNFQVHLSLYLYPYLHHLLPLLPLLLLPLASTPSFLPFLPPLTSSLFLNL